MIMCVLLCYPVSIHMSQLQATGRPISSYLLEVEQWEKVCSGNCVWKTVTKIIMNSLSISCSLDPWSTFLVPYIWTSSSPRHFNN